MLTYNLIIEIAVALWGNKDPKLSCPDESFSYPGQAVNVEPWMVERIVNKILNRPLRWFKLIFFFNCAYVP